MKKTISMLTVMMIVALTMTGCTTYRSYTFNVQTNEQIKVQLNTSNGQKLSQNNGRFTITDDEDTVISIGIFYLEEPFNQLYDTIETLEGVKIIETGNQDNSKFIFYKIKTEIAVEYNYLVKLDDSRAGIVINNIISEESARDAFELLKFEVNPD